MLIRVLADLAESAHRLARSRLVFAYGALVTCREARAVRHLARGAVRATRRAPLSTVRARFTIEASVLAGCHLVLACHAVLA